MLSSSGFSAKKRRRPQTKRKPGGSLSVARV